VTITNGYTTLAELKERMLDIFTYTATTISFSSTTKTIADSAGGLKRFEDANNISTLIKIAGAANSGNNGVKTISTVSATAVVVTNTLTTEAAGSSVTITINLGLEYDATLESIIEASSRLIDKYCARQFYSSTSTRYYETNNTDEVFTDDILSVSTLKTDQDGDGTYETAWTENTHFYLYPYNSVADGKPFTRVIRTETGGYEFPATIRKCIEIYGSFGYCTTANLPKVIKEACILQSIKLFKRKDAPFGIAGTNQFGVITNVPELDPDIKMLLDSYRRLM